MNDLSVSVIIPVCNESETIGELVAEIRRLHPQFEIIVIDDGSRDETAEAAERAGAVVYRHPYNVGNGAAVKTGIRVASKDILVLMDGDGQHAPQDIRRLLEHMPEYDLVVGARTRKCQATVWRGIGNWVYNRLASYVAKFRIQDLTSGFRAVKSDIAKSFVYLLPNTYSYPTTITLGVLRSGWSLKYVPIETCKRTRGKSQIRLMQDGVRFFMIITRIATFYSPMRVFLPVSFVMFLLGLLRYVYSFFSEGRFTNMSALLFVSAVIVFMMSLISEQICQMRFERRAMPRAARHSETEDSVVRPMVTAGSKKAATGGQ